MVGEDLIDQLEGQIMLRILDARWMQHLSEMDYLKTGIGLRAIGQRDPLVEYKNEAYAAFENMTATMYDDFLRTILRLEITLRVETLPSGEQRKPDDNLVYSDPEANLGQSNIPRPAASAQGGAPAAVPAQSKPVQQKAATYEKDKEDPFANVGRNDPCPCGSGKKYKKCHGA